MANQQGQAFEDLRNTVSECTRIVRHRWQLALIGITVVSSAAFWYSQYLPREYTASTLFERRDDVVLQNLIQSNSPYGFDHLRNTLTLDMTGSRALAKAAATAGLVPSDTVSGEGALTESERSALDGALGQYKLRTTVQLPHSSRSLDTILLRCAANDPTVARDFVVATRDNYIADTRERIQEILNGTKEFFESEVARLQQEVARAEDHLRKDFDEFPGLDPTDLVGVGNRLETLRMQRNGVHRRKAELEAQIAAREQFLVSAPGLFAQPAESAETPAAIALPSPPLTVDVSLEKGIEAVKMQIVEHVTGMHMTMEHPDVVRLVSHLEALEELRNTLRAAMPEPESASVSQVPKPTSETLRQWQTQQMRVELELDSLRRQLDIALRQCEEVDARVERFAGLYEQLVNEGDNLRQMLDTRREGHAELAIWQGHLVRLERVLAAESGQRGTQFALIEEPKHVSRPTKPRVSSIFVVCSGLGLAAAALLVALAELFDRSFRSVGQVTRALAVPVLECISVIPTPKERRRNMLSRLIWTPTLAMLVLVLLTTAGLAYASIERPDLHRRTMNRVDRMLDTVGVAAVLPLNDRHVAPGRYRDRLP